MQERSALQDWLIRIPVMQQTVLMSAIRGPDGFRKRHPAKALIRYYRRSILLSAFDGCALSRPYLSGGGDFTGPSLDVLEGPGGQTYCVTRDVFDTLPPDKVVMYNPDWRVAMLPAVNAFLQSRDEMTLHYYAHAMHAFQILGCKHPDPEVRTFWDLVYVRMVNALHLNCEEPDALDKRLGDNEAGWRDRSDEAGSCST